jgi:ABC-type bacteriocin/lantibiotic exporter with double-glycine peptidase domain
MNQLNEGVFDDPLLKDKPLKRFFRLLSLDRKDLYRVYIFALFTGVISLMLPLAIQAIISQIMGAQLSSSLFVLISVVTVATFFSGAFQIMQLKIIEDIQRRIFTRTTFEFALKIPDFKAESINSVYPPELINRFFDIIIIEKGLPKIIIDLSVSIVSIVMGLILLTFYHQFFILFGIVLMVFMYVMFRYTGEIGYRTKFLQSTYKYKVAHWLEELGRLLISFKLMPQPNIAINNTDKIVSHYLDAREKHFNILMLQYTLVIIFKTIIISGLLILGTLLVVNNELNLGQFVAAEIIIFLVLNSVEKLILTLESVYEVLVGMEKISSVLSMPVETEVREEARLTNMITDTVSIKMSGVGYSAFDNNHQALKDINLEIKAGEKICISGGNGSGKSTLIHLLSGIYSNYTGSISINNFPLQNYLIDDLKKMIGACFYDEDIFTGTIAENIIAGNNEYSGKMVEVTEALGLKEFIHSLPQGYDTMLIPENRKYPKTIIKKIVLARNVLKRPALLLLENFLSIYEPAEMERITNYLLSDRHQWTICFVTNSPDIAAKCDRVILLDNGSIIFNDHYNNIINEPKVKSILKNK